MTRDDQTPLILRPGVRLVPVAELVPVGSLRNFSSVTEHHVAVVRDHARGPLRVVGPDTARLLALFNTPTSVATAIEEFSSRCGADPARTLIDVAPILLRLLRSTLLVPADRAAHLATGPTFAVGRRIDNRLSIRECIHLTDDTEVYRARHHGRDVALKILRPPLDPAVVCAFDRELHVLAGMDNIVNAPVLDAGMWNGRPYLLLGLRPGVPVTTAADLLRGPLPDHATRLHRLACALVEAYEHLHSVGVVHGDVHPGNVIVGPDSAISVLDYGNSAPLSHLSGCSKGDWSVGVPQFAAPEVFAGGPQAPAPPPTASSEQYSVAALIDVIVAGVPLRAGSIVSVDFLASIANQPRPSFAERGIAPWPALERVLDRALDIDPLHRFGSLGEFADELRHTDAVSSERRAHQTATARTQAGGTGGALLDVLVRDAARVLAEPREPWPTEDATVANGDAGVGLALLEVARNRADYRLLALADVYVTRAARHDLRRAPRPRSVFYGAAGVHLAQATMASGLHEIDSLTVPTNRLLEAGCEPTGPADLVTGRAGVLLACAVLLEELKAAGSPVPTTQMRAIGNDLCSSITERVPRAARGMAHGRVGQLFSALRWCSAANQPVPPGIEQAVQDLAAKVAAVNPGRRGGPASWCSGSSGDTVLWALAARLLPGPEQFLRLAEEAATEAWNCADPALDLCCGMSGRAYAMLQIYRLSGALLWLRRARDVAERAAERAAREMSGTRRFSLWHGALGVALLAGQLEEPDALHLPLM